MTAPTGEQAAGQPAPGEPAPAELVALASQVVTALAGRGQTVAVAESLTGGLLAASLVEIPGASAVFRGGVVAYATDLKATLLGVPRSLLDRYGAVHADVAGAMADGVRDRLGATFGLATTGVAGPDPADGQPVGTVHIAISAGAVSGGAAGGGRGGLRRRFAFTGGRRAIRLQSVAGALHLLRDLLADGAGPGP